MSRPVQWGILSTSRINASVLSAARMTDDARFLAVASRDQERANAYAEEQGLERAYGSYDALLEDPEVEAVYISLPNHLHLEWTARALEAGKHVLCEKPLGVDPAAVAKLAVMAKNARLVLSEGFMYRHHPQTRRVAGLVRDGAIGRLALVRASFSFQLADPERDVRARAAFEGGALLDLGSYCVNVARLLAGEPEWAFGSRRNDWGDVDRDFVGVLKFAGDATAVFDASLGMPIRDQLEIVGTAGRLEVHDPWHARAPKIVVHHAYSVEEVVCEIVDPYRLEVEDVSRAIRGNGGPLVNPDDALGQAAALAALMKSSEMREPVEVSVTATDLPAMDVAGGEVIP